MKWEHRPPHIVELAIIALLSFMLFAMAAVARAEDGYVMPKIPTEAEKIEALKLAYKLNGNSMVGSNLMIDLTDPRVTATPVPTVIVKPDPAPQVLEKKAEAVQDTCTRHGLRKVIRGHSWRCR